jgi:hypothetical protein
MMRGAGGGTREGLRWAEGPSSGGGTQHIDGRLGYVVLSSFELDSADY